MYDFVTVIKTKLFPVESSKKKENMPSIKHFVWLHAHYSTSARNSEKTFSINASSGKKLTSEIFRFSNVEPAYLRSSVGVRNGKSQTYFVYEDQNVPRTTRTRTIPFTRPCPCAAGKKLERIVAFCFLHRGYWILCCRTNRSMRPLKDT